MEMSINKTLLLAASFVAWQSVAAPHGAAGASKRVPSDVAGVDLVVSCQPGPIATDYVAETASSMPLSDRYAVERGADKGLVRLMSRGGHRAKRYVIRRQAIRAIVALRYDMIDLDRVDLVSTARDVAFVHTSTANAGIFTISEVYELPVSPSGRVDKTALKGDAQLTRLLVLGLSAFRPDGGCDVEAAG